MNKYRITSVHSIYEDSYTEGEGKIVNEWYNNATISADTVQGAIRKYYDSELNMDYVPEYTEVEENRLFDSRLVDENNCKPTESELLEWKNGNLALYSENITLYVDVLSPVDLENALKK